MAPVDVTVVGSCTTRTEDRIVGAATLALWALLSLAVATSVVGRVDLSELPRRGDARPIARSLSA
jgi:hypothetical protein